MDPPGIIALISVAILVWALFCAIPGWVAEAHNHSKCSAIKALSMLSFFIPALWLAAIVWSLTEDNRGRPENEARVTSKFEVCGVDRDTKMEVVDFIWAASEANARAKAEIDGVVVTSVRHAATPTRT